MAHKTTLSSIGDPLSELNVQRRLNFLRESCGGGVVIVPTHWLKGDPALQRAVRNLDWLKTKTHQAQQQEEDPS